MGEPRVSDEVYHAAVKAYFAPPDLDRPHVLDFPTQIRAALAVAVKAERERCAAIAESLGVYPELNSGTEWHRHAKRIAAAIRAEP